MHHIQIWTRLNTIKGLKWLTRLIDCLEFDFWFYEIHWFIDVCFFACWNKFNLELMVWFNEMTTSYFKFKYLYSTTSWLCNVMLCLPRISYGAIYIQPLRGCVIWRLLQILKKNHFLVVRCLFRISIYRQIHPLRSCGSKIYFSRFAYWKIKNLWKI